MGRFCGNNVLRTLNLPIRGGPGKSIECLRTRLYKPRPETRPREFQRTQPRFTWELAEWSGRWRRPTPYLDSCCRLHALRRTPPTDSTPYATTPPVLRILYAVCQHAAGEDIAVVLLGGDKTALGNAWYPTNVAEAEHRLDQYCRQDTATTPIVKRGNR